MSQKINPIQQLNGVQTQANSGSAGGTIYYINLGGIKMMWGLTAASATSTTTSQTTIVPPSGFFNTIQSTTISPANMTSDARQYAVVASMSPTTILAAVYTISGTAGSQMSFMVIGT